jgi:hypothetical protein
LFQRSSSIESLGARLGLGAARTPRRAVAWLAELRAPKEDVRVRVEAGRSDFLASDALCDSLGGEQVV